MIELKGIVREYRNGDVVTPALTGIDLCIGKGEFAAVMGASGSGKTTMVLEMLMPALQSRIDRSPQPTQVRLLEADGVSKAHLIDATPIGAKHTFHRRYILRRP